MKQEILDILLIPAEWKYKIEKVTYVIFSIETEESYIKTLAENAAIVEGVKAGRGFHDCERGGIKDCGSISIKADISNYVRIIEEKYDELRLKYGARLRSIQLT
jgi:hypothetical protein